MAVGIALELMSLRLSLTEPIAFFEGASALAQKGACDRRCKS